MAKKDPLSEKRKKFCMEYLKDFNATQAAIRAGYEEKGAHVTASRVLSDVKVQHFLQRKTKKSFDKVEVSVEGVLLELKRLAQCDINEAFSSEQKFKRLDEIPVDVRKCIAGIEVQEFFEGRGDKREQAGVIKKIKFWDKNKALEMLGKYLKMFVDKVEHSADENLSAILDKSWKTQD